MSDNIVCYFLQSGQEIIGKEVSSDVEFIELAKPRVVQMQLMPNGNLGVALLPFSVNAMEENVMIYRSSIVGLSMKVKTELENKYIEETTGLVLAQK